MPTVVAAPPSECIQIGMSRASRSSTCVIADGTLRTYTASVLRLTSRSSAESGVSCDSNTCAPPRSLRACRVR